MTAAKLASLISLAQFCWKDVHWQKTAAGPRPVREPLKKQHLDAHLAGGPAVGLAPIVPGHDTTKIAVFDFDSHQGDISFDKMREIAREVYNELQACGIDAVPFKSSGGKGIHLIMLWSSDQDAYSVRERLRLTLAHCNLKSGAKGVRYNEVEIFPKQDSVPLDGFGNMFVLPWAGESVQLDTADFHPITRTLVQPLTWPMSAPVSVFEHPLPPVRRLPAAVGADTARLREKLQAIPNEGIESIGYDEWFRVVAGIHHETNGSDEGLLLAHEFSARSPKYDPAFLDDRVWPYIRSDRENAATINTIAKIAQTHENVADDFEVLPPLPEASVVPASSGARFRLIPATEFARRAPPEWIVEGVIPDAELVVVYGESGSGKSFWVLDLIAGTCQGKPWRDCQANPYRAAYIAAEAAGGFRNRLVAYATHFETNLERLPLWVVENGPNFLKTEDVRELVLELKRCAPIDVLVVDTWAQVTPGANENAGEDMGRALANCRALHRATGATVVLIHHAGKDLSKGARGWSGLRAAADAEIEISRLGDDRLATITKQKDGSDGRKFPFKLAVIPIGNTARGQVIDSCVVTHQDKQARTAREPSGANERLIWKCINDIAELCGDVTVEAAINESLKHKPRIEGQRDQRRGNLIRALEGLAENGFISINNDQILFMQA